jgi:tetratricopeptide (TPR) repeat protein
VIAGLSYFLGKERIMRIVIGAAAVLLIAGVSVAQTPADRERARIQNRLGWEALRSEQYPLAIKSFQSAIAIRPDYEYAHYGLGRAFLAGRRYGEAVTVLERCRDLYRAQGGRQFTSIQEAQRFRQDRILEIDEQIRLLQTARPTAQSQDLVRQYELARRNLQETIRRDTGLTIDSGVPPWVSLSLGSAYFRMGRLADAEREYKATIDADARSGEAHSNLAVVYLETQRFDLALRSIEAASKTGFKVNPELAREIKARAR